MPGEFAVIGLGQFGRAVARCLAREGQSVLAVDLDPERIERVADDVDAAVALDATDEEALAGLELERLSCVVVTLGQRAREASILTTALLRQHGVPRIVARAHSYLHARVLRAVGAHEVVDPENEMGERLALHLAYPGIEELVQLGDASIAEVDAPESLVGKSLAELELRGRHGVSVLAFRRGDKVKANPRPDDRVESGDELVLLGRLDAIRRLGALA
jgi:trk system potassium uptake protein TrkA